MQLITVVERFVADVTAGKTNATPAAYRSKLQHLVNYLGPECQTVTQTDIDRFRVHLLTRKTKRRGGQEVKGQLSIFTIRSVLATTRHFLTWSSEKGYLAKIELRNVTEPSPQPKAVEALTVENLLASASNVGEPWEQARNTALIYVLRDTGGRVGAIAGIDLGSMDLQAGYATAPDKNGQIAWLWFNAPTVAAIRAWLEIRPGLHPNDYRLFTGRRGDGLSTSGIRHILTRLASAAGISGRHNPHAFRHAFARDAILAGADLGQVSEMMGHHGIVVTAKYYARWHQTEIQGFHQKYSPGKTLPVPRSAKP